MMPSLTRRGGLAVATIVLLGLNLIGTQAVWAQSADSIAANLNNNGVFVGDGADGSVVDFEAVVSQLNSEGFDLRIASLGTEPNNPEAVVDDLRDLTSATVLMITPQSVFASSPAHSANAINEALDRADFSNLADGALTFGRTLGGISATSPADAATADATPAGDTSTGSATTSTTETSGSG
ncbi:MAG: hypothetical protein GXP35_04745, partial [Actinobacteria bacterium]|nr:hypothetical protein [Actinomycetota bacterium]